MKNNNKTTKFIFLHPYIKKNTTSNRLWLLSFISLLTLILTFLTTLNYTKESATVSSTAYPLPTTVINTLIHYASNSNLTYKMSNSHLNSISDVLKNCSFPCNFLVFGLTQETLLWNSINPGGRTIFIDENKYYAENMEQKYPEIEVYDVLYMTKLKDMNELLVSTKEHIGKECKPVQNLLFSECKLAINDLPNHVYEVDWDVILVDGPQGTWPEAPGRMSPIFTSSVLARSKKGGSDKTHVFVHDYNRDLERICFEFLCRQNLVESSGILAHFVLEKMDENSIQFCGSGTPSSSG